MNNILSEQENMHALTAQLKAFELESKLSDYHWIYKAWVFASFGLSLARLPMELKYFVDLIKYMNVPNRPGYWRWNMIGVSQNAKVIKGANLLGWGLISIVPIFIVVLLWVRYLKNKKSSLETYERLLKSKVALGPNQSAESLLERIKQEQASASLQNSANSELFQICEKHQGIIYSLKSNMFLRASLICCALNAIAISGSIFIRYIDTGNTWLNWLDAIYCILGIISRGIVIWIGAVMLITRFSRKNRAK